MKARFFPFFVLFFSLFLTASIPSCIAEEIFDQAIEKLAIGNIKQLTFPSMGFEKAGEAYFSPDSQTIIFQAVPKGEEHYQIYTMNLNETIPVMVSTGKGACTCA